MWFNAAIEVLSKPTTATSSGTIRPWRSMTSIAPTAERSLAVKIAVGKHGAAQQPLGAAGSGLFGEVAADHLSLVGQTEGAHGAQVAAAARCRTRRRVRRRCGRCACARGRTGARRPGARRAHRRWSPSRRFDFGRTRPTETTATSSATASSLATGRRQPATMMPSTREARKVSSARDSSRVLRRPLARMSW